MRKIMVLILFFGLILKTAWATEEFKTDYRVRYTVQNNGIVKVTQEIALTNLLSNVYVTQYSLTFKNTQVENISAEDEGGQITPQVKQDKEQTEVSLTFNEEVVGTGKIKNFKVYYDALGLAEKNGQIWEVNIPRLSEQTQANNYSLTLVVPTSFGNPAFIRPSPVESRQEGEFNLYRFTKNQISSSGVNANFGQFQVFNFNLQYHLSNPSSLPGKIEISLPPDTSFQQVTYQNISPEPINVTVDEDGNWLATYVLQAKEKLNVVAKGKVNIFASAQTGFPPSNQENLAKNLLSQEYWELEDPLIKQKASELKTAKKIYDYVVKTLDYDFDRVKEGSPRLGAIQALKNPQNAICMEFTDLFIALARAAGIPAREINGYAYTTNVKLRPLSLVADILHSWPEYWDKDNQIWVPVDPTWGKTTGGNDYFSKNDLNHFTFVIHGVDSRNPYPAGAYKTEENQGRDIEVTFGKSEQEENGRLSVIFNLPSKIFDRLINQGTLTIKNTGPKSLYNLNLEIVPQGLIVQKPESLISSLALLPPYGSRQIILKLKPISFLSLGQGSVKLIANGQEFTQEVKIGSLFWQIFLPLFFIVLILLALIILTRKYFYAKKIVR